MPTVRIDVSAPNIHCTGALVLLTVTLSVAWSATTFHFQSSSSASSGLTCFFAAWSSSVEVRTRPFSLPPVATIRPSSSTCAAPTRSPSSDPAVAASVVRWRCARRPPPNAATPTAATPTNTRAMRGLLRERSCSGLSNAVASSISRPSPSGRSHSKCREDAEKNVTPTENDEGLLVVSYLQHSSDDLRGGSSDRVPIEFR